MADKRLGERGSLAFAALRRVRTTEQTTEQTGGILGILAVFLLQCRWLERTLERRQQRPSDSFVNKGLCFESAAIGVARWSPSVCDIWGKALSEDLDRYAMLSR